MLQRRNEKHSTTFPQIKRKFKGSVNMYAKTTRKTPVTSLFPNFIELTEGSLFHQFRYHPTPICSRISYQPHGTPCTNTSPYKPFTLRTRNLPSVRGLSTISSNFSLSDYTLGNSIQYGSFHMIITPILFVEIGYSYVTFHDVHMVFFVKHP